MGGRKYADMEGRKSIVKGAKNCSKFDNVYKCVYLLDPPISLYYIFLGNYHAYKMMYLLEVLFVAHL